ncbi:MAG: hypothetical protein CM15mP78_15050 [Candidatus Poseidoniales archaeon]|nr:MAG: hypothetical protein CM15mP78_15050 [Candidatus Poseidoniales archaeon]
MGDVFPAPSRYFATRNEEEGPLGPTITPPWRGKPFEIMFVDGNSSDPPETPREGISAHLNHKRATVVYQTPF